MYIYVLEEMWNKHGVLKFLLMYIMGDYLLLYLNGIRKLFAFLVDSIVSLLNVIYVYFDILHIQGLIQDFLIGGSNLQRGV